MTQDRGGAARGWPASTRLVVVVSALLTVLYWLVGDRTTWSECLTVWPPLLWWLVLLPLSIHPLVLGRRRAFAASVGFPSLFLLTTTEWRSFVRSEDAALRDRFESIWQRPVADGPVGLRVVTWNVAGRLRLDVLEAYQADLCFVQESGWSPPEGGLSGVWSGFHWAPGDDGGVLSRYPLTSLPTRRVGPWAEPQILLMELPGARRILLGNVRLVLPSVVQAVASLRWPTGLASGHRGRTRQFVELAALLEATLQEQDTRSLILAGDFNTPGGLPSLSPLERVAADVWPRRGLGWGGTMTSEFPLSRIDQCWVSADIEPVAARVHRGAGSDHRLLIVDLIVP